MQWSGFGWGNALPAPLFGALHLALFATLLGDGLTVVGAVVLTVPPTLTGWMLGYLW